ncbi:DUF2141 domain-containing protein [Chitinimonas sp.]|uniref:DUF2141 domain-containing protein n=1 Tax=Chitinimonas sp. TaxID=1934313 RepID=UPI0035AEAE72
MRFLPILSLCLLSAGYAAELTITVDNIKSDHGQILVAAYGKDQFLKQPVAVGRAVAASGKVVLTLNALPEGELAVSVIHDEDSNGKLNTNLLGMPTEPYGFSNDAAGQFGPPSFDQAKIQIVAGSNATQLKLR